MQTANVTSQFTRHHNFEIPDFLKEDKQSIQWLHDVKRSIDQSVASHSERLLTEGDPIWAMLLTMLDRVYEHAAASLVAYFTGTWASLEVVVRATVEASVTVLYVTHADRHSRLGQYLTHYFVYARKAVDRGDASVRTQALHNLEWRESIIRQVAQHEGIPFPVVGWPSNVLDRFKAVGMETEYRHLYAVLSGQAHNDADSLIDCVITRGLASHDNQIEELARVEVHYWMRFYFYSGLRYYSRAAHSYASALGFVDSIAGTQRIETELAAILQTLTHDFRQSKPATA